MNGDIGFISDEKSGSTFWFTFQCEVNPIPDESVLDLPSLVDKRILYFEPHTHSRIATSELMESWKMHVYPATSLEQVSYALLQDEGFDYALIGHDVTPTALNELKQLIISLQSNIPSIHLAINSNSPNLQEALVASGANSCLSKPLTPERLSRALVPQKIDLTNALQDVLESKIAIKVLAVDDNDANLKLINALLLEQVSEVIVASNGKEAVELCRNEKFALIFMDIQMPVMDGISALSLIKAQTFNDKTPIIAVTAHALSGEKDKLLKQGFDSYMTKPIDEAMLRHTIYEYCDLNLLGTKHSQKLAEPTKDKAPVLTDKSIGIVNKDDKLNNTIDWSLALKRAGNKAELAKDMLKGLVTSLPETKQLISDALTSQDIEQLKTLVHKLNGACCYSGVPNLGKMTHHIETELKKGAGIDDLEPEFFEFFEHIESVINYAPDVFKQLSDAYTD